MTIAFEKKGHTSCLPSRPHRRLRPAHRFGVFPRRTFAHLPGGAQEMSESRAELVPALHPAGMLVRRMGQSLRHYWTDAAGYQKLLYVVGTVLLVSAVVHLCVILVTGGSWQGPVSWRKPITFGFSFGVTCWTLGWILSYLPARQRIGWTLSGGFSVAALGEVFLISMQQWRGVASHFNFATPFDDTVFTIMGNLVTIIGVIVLILTVWTFISLQAPPSLALAI